MTISGRPHLTSLALLGLSCAGNSLADESFLRLSADSPEISVNSRKPGQAAIRLPALQYTFRVDARCGSGKSPRSMLLSIADTRRSFSSIDIQQQATAEITMKIPAGQIAPLLLNDFCVNRQDVDQNAINRITVYGALSAQAALLCSDDNDEQMIYASHALDLVFRCVANGSADGIRQHNDNALHNPDDIPTL